MIHVLHRSRVDRYFSGELEPAAVKTLFDGLWRCATCRARYERQLLLERVLPKNDPHESDRLWQSIVGSAAPEPRRAPREAHLMGRRALLALSLAVAGVVLVPALLKQPATTTPVSRGTGSAPPAPSLHLYRTHEGHSEPVHGDLHPDDGVLVAYSNPSSNLAYLMVFGVDQRGGVHWYYPAYDRTGEDPAAVRIRTNAFGVELGEEIRHPLPEGDMRIFALFLTTPHRVLETEAAVSTALAAHGGSVRDLEKLPLVDGEQTSLLLKVRP
jgi:hypothetical protein